MSDTEINWQDYLAGHRMAVDREFSSRVRDSNLNSQQWGLVMTAAEFEIENPDDPQRATLVLSTDRLEHVLPAMEATGGHPAAGPGGDGSGAGGGVFDWVKNALGVGGGKDDTDALTEEAERLTADYASRLQRRLQEEGEWDEIRQMASRSSGS